MKYTVEMALGGSVRIHTKFHGHQYRFSKVVREGYTKHTDSKVTS
jgi:hypothetical protein